MSVRRHIAVDLGASGGRVALGTIEDGKLEVEVLHRFPNGGVVLTDNLYWDIVKLWREIQHGLTLAAQKGAIESVGVNSWGVDYGLIGEDGELLEGVHHYRSSRTDGTMDAVIADLGRSAIYEATGIQFMPINTIYQLKAHVGDSLDRAKWLLMVPDLFHFWLSGQRSNERTIASTSQLYDPQVGDWSKSLLESLHLREDLFGPISDPGTILGEVSPEIAELTGLKGTKVVLPAAHDTASAVAAVPAEGDDWAYISSGTWSLVGIETPSPVVTEQALVENLTNEAGVNGTTRLLKNVMGLWMLQECRRAWGDPDYADLYAEAEVIEGGPTFDPDELKFLAPGTDMPDRIRSSCDVGESRGEIVRCIFDSLAAKSAAILDVLERVSGRSIKTVHVVGGGSNIALLNRLIAEKSGRKVVAGPIEATLIGNLLVQAEACGSIPLGSIREVVRNGTPLTTYS